MYLDLKIIKKHLRVDFDDDDEYILELASVCEDAVQRHLDTPLSHLAAQNSGDLPPAVRQAMLLLLGHMYANREAVSNAQSHEIPLAYQYLLQPYINYKGVTLCGQEH